MIQFIQKFKQKSPQQRFLFILGLVMFSFYLVLGLMFMFWDDMPFDIERKYRVAFAALLIVYAVIRFYRILKND